VLPDEARRILGADGSGARCRAVRRWAL